MKNNLIIVSDVFEMEFRSNSTIENLLEIGRYDIIFDRSLICRARLRAHIPGGLLKMKFIVFKEDPTIEEILLGFRKEGLRRPRIEDVLLFGAKFPEEQCKRRLVFFCRDLSKKETSTRAIVLNGIKSSIDKIQRAISVRDTGLGSNEAYVGVCFE